MINFSHGVFYAINYFSKFFCYSIISKITPRGELNRGYNAESYSVTFTDEMINELSKFFSDMRKEYPEMLIPKLIVKRTAEVLEYQPGQSLPPHYDSPYCRAEYIPFIAVINLNEGYKGGLFFDRANLAIEGIGSIAFCNTSFTNIHSVKEVEGKVRYSLIFDVNYPEMLNRYGNPSEWFEV